MTFVYRSVWVPCLKTNSASSNKGNLLDISCVINLLGSSVTPFSCLSSSFVWAHSHLWKFATWRFVYRGLTAFIIRYFFLPSVFTFSLLHTHASSQIWLLMSQKLKVVRKKTEILERVTVYFTGLAGKNLGLEETKRSFQHPCNHELRVMPTKWC